jgi:hypothetical protein
MTPPEVQHLFSDPIPYPTSSFWFRSLINEQIFLKEMHDGLEGHVLGYAKFHLVKTLPFFMNDGLRDINLNTHLLYIPPTPTNFTDLLLHKKYADILRYFVTPQPDLVLLVIGSVFWISVSVLWLLGTLLSIVKRDERMWFFLIASGIILYFAVLSSPVIQPRYRMPATPFLFLLASETLLGLYTIVRRRYLHPTVPSTSQVPE